MSAKRVVIVGGGFAGLSAAYTLMKRDITPYGTAFRLCEELGLPLVPSQMKFGHYRNGRWVTTTPDQSLWNFLRHLRAAFAMGFLSPSGMWAGTPSRLSAIDRRRRAFDTCGGRSRIAAARLALGVVMPGGAYVWGDWAEYHASEGVSPRSRD